MTKFRAYFNEFVPANEIESQGWLDFNILCRFADCVHPYNQ